MQASKLAEGLWRWVIPHPDWKPEFDRPDGWARLVASTYAEYDEAVVLIDPLVPPGPAEAERFWTSLDDDIARLARPILVLVGSVDHGRSADLVAARYLALGRSVRIVGDATIRGLASCALNATFDDATLPAGLRAVPIPGMSPGERAFFLEPWRAAVFADAVIGAGGGQVRVAPPSWGVKTKEGRDLYDRSFRPSLRSIAAMHPRILLPSHGEPVQNDGTAALEQALEAPAWGA